ncbi:glycosyltransferase family 4 protein [Pisolithus microcarpus 441]|uniref:GDP-Man:Man(3)GlcNAc(2)-PP-Dol alpha-1,2-mannosyltransferase n=1 Tax=Pisolithus microcarpus 441 TaxID=765257 RepID=A0A0C9YVB5_9AGAM|nr:glycosyltransferase family 4 protein [Pisolithus microcarpus]KIK14107.1 glycosyltransferase family 4 protein [Pisolithus microcarpus 441]
MYHLLVGLTLVATILAYIAYTESIWSKSLKTRQAVLDQLGLKRVESKRYKFVGFFHPYCNAGGGGERVLWTAIAHIQRQHKDIICVVYSGDTDASKTDIINKVKARFAIDLEPSTLHFVYLKSRHLVEDSRWPRFTILGQSMGSIYLAWEAMCEFIPDLYIDTMGYAFTFPAVTWLTRAAVPIGAYVHYPTISTDMLGRVRAESWKMRGKRLNSYYRLMMYYYALSLSHARFLMVNSSWTRNHIASILSHEHFGPTMPRALRTMLCMNDYLAGGSQAIQNVEPAIVYPPCDMREMVKFRLDDRERIILSVAQFRPEKDHTAQLRAFAQLLMDHPEYKSLPKDEVRLVLLGGARNSGDLDRVGRLRSLASDLDILSHVTFVVNASYPEVLEWLSRSSIGLSTMVDEHFGINIVEFMAAGLIPLVHASGGPLHDIVVPYQSRPTGFHAKTPGEFATAMHEILTVEPLQMRALRERGRTWATERFSEDKFVEGWEKSGWRSHLP